MESVGKKTKKNIPWWIYLILAIVSYLSCKYLVQVIDVEDRSLQLFLNQAPKAAPILAIVFLLLAANGLYANDKPPENENEVDPTGQNQEEDQDQT